MSHSIFNKSEINDKKDQIIKMSQSLSFYVKEYADKKLLNLWAKIPWWIVKADLGRLIYVYLNGGFYFDVDCLIKKNFHSEVGESMVCLLYTSPSPRDTG